MWSKARYYPIKLKRLSYSIIAMETTTLSRTNRLTFRKTFIPVLIVFVLTCTYLSYKAILPQHALATNIKPAITTIRLFVDKASACEAVLIKDNNSTESWWMYDYCEECRSKGFIVPVVDGEIRRLPCPCLSPYLVGPSPVNLSVPTWEEVSRAVGTVRPDGAYGPRECSARQTIAIIIPYSNREPHLRLLLRHLHPFLQRQQARYIIIVAEEIRIPLFNRALTFNIGFKEALKRIHPDCVIFHDVDLLPENDWNLYRCEDHPLHLAVQTSQYRYRLMYPKLIGGVLAMKRETFVAVNGFSNIYYGWGKEDDDMYLRLQSVGEHIVRHNGNVSSYKSITHSRDSGNLPNAYNGKLLSDRQGFYRRNTFSTDGLSDLQYNVKEVINHPLFTHIKVEADTPLHAYPHTSDAIPDITGSLGRSSVSPLRCAEECNAHGTTCAGFVYNFSRPLAPVTCYLLPVDARSETQTMANVKFFIKEILKV